MEPAQSRTEPVKWMGGEPAEGDPSRSGDLLDTGELWFGRHGADLDILVLDPSRTDPRAEPVSLYSLSQHRTRSFPRAVVLRQVLPLTDAAERERARTEYEDRAALRRAHEAAAEEEAVRRRERLRESVADSHRAYLAQLGIEYAGVSETSGSRIPGHRGKCHVCGIAIDDFAGMACRVCGSALCSCGACACGRPRRGRPRPAEAAGEE